MASPLARMRFLARLFSLAASLAVAAAQGAEAGGPVPPLESFAAVTDDMAVDVPGCDQITVVDVKAGWMPTAHSPFRVSPGQLAATSDGTLVASLSSNWSTFLLLMTRPDPGSDAWSTVVVVDERRPYPLWALGGAVAISPDDAVLLVATMNGVEKYSLDEVTALGLGPVAGSAIFDPRSAQVPQAPTAADIVFGTKATTAYIVATDGFVYVLDVPSMLFVGERVAYQPTAQARQDRIRRTYASLSPDERYLVINTATEQPRHVTVVDLDSRRAELVALPGLTQSWGLAFDYVGSNHGLLAVHGGTGVAVYAFTPRGGLDLMASIDVPGGTIKDLLDRGAREEEIRINALAWSGTGDELIVARGLPGLEEWRVLSFDDDGARSSLPFESDHDSCQSDQYWPLGLDVVTLNDRLERPTLTPTPTSTPSPSATPTGTASPPPPATATALPSATPTSAPTATASPTSPPLPVYLPLALSERCVPERRRVDAVLVLDASTSMLELTAAGHHTKLDAAREAASAFLDQLRPEAGDLAAIVAFNAAATLLQPLTARRADLDAALGRLAAAEQTRLDLGVAAAHAELTSPRRRSGNVAVMVVLTDGRANPVGPEAAVGAARRAKDDRVVVFTVGLGEDLDLAALEAMASERAYFHRAPDADDLAAIYAAIAVTIPCDAGATWGRR